MNISITIVLSIFLFYSSIVNAQHITDKMDESEAKHYFASQLSQTFSDQRSTSLLTNKAHLGSISLDNVGNQLSTTTNKNLIEAAVLFVSRHERIGFNEQEKILELIVEGDAIMNSLPPTSYQYKGRDFLAPVLILLIDEIALNALNANKNVAAVTKRNDEEGYAYILRKTTK